MRARIPSLSSSFGCQPLHLVHTPTLQFAEMMAEKERLLADKNASLESLTRAVATATQAAATRSDQANKYKQEAAALVSVCVRGG